MKHSVIQWTLATLCAFCWTIGAFTLTAHAQNDNWLWVKTADSVRGKITPTSIASDMNGNTYIAGSFQGRAVFGNSSLTTAGGEDAFIMKYNRKGEVEWAKRFGGRYNESISGFGLDGLGNLYCTGVFFSDTVSIESDTMFRSANGSIFVAKFSSEGDLKWAESPFADGYNALGKTNTATSIAVTKFGEVYITGSYQTLLLTFGDKTVSKLLTADTLTNNMFIARYTSDGLVLWAKEFGEENDDIGRVLTTDNEGNCYLSGTFAGPKITFGTTVLSNTTTTSPLSTDFFLLKISPMGAITWAKQGAGTKSEEVRAIKTDTAGNCYITGTFRSPKFTLGTLTLDSKGLGTAFIIKLATDGSIVWGKSFGGQSEEIVTGISFDVAQNAYICGTFRSDIVNFGGPIQLINNGDIFTSDIFIAKFAPNGDILSATGGGSQSNDIVSGISVDADGQFLITGYAQSDTIKFGDKKAIVTSIKDSVSGGSTNIFIAKYGNGVVGVEEGTIIPSGKVLCYPQPVTREITFKYTLGNQSPICVDIIDVLGNQVATIFQNNTIIGENSVTCSLDIPTGIYFYRLSASQITERGMFQVMR